MKRFNLRKWWLMLALVILIQNGTVIVSNTSDKPYLDDDIS